MPSEELTVSATTVPAALLELAEADPSVPLVTAKRRGRWEQHTRERLLTRVAAVARGLSELGVGPGATVVLAAADQPAWLEMDLAVQATGARVCPVPPDAPESLLRDAIAATGARIVVLSEQELVDRLLDLLDEGELALDRIVEQSPGGTVSPDPRVLGIEALTETGATAGGDLAWLGRTVGALDPEAPAVVAISSGAVGPVRTVELRHDALLRATRAVIEATGLSGEDRVLSYRALADPTERTTTIGAALLSGALLALPESRDQVADAAYEIAPTYVHATRRWLDRTSAEVVGRLLANRGLKKLVSRGWVRRFLGGEGDASAGPLLRGPIVQKLGLSSARLLVVSGSPLGTRERRFAAAFGLPVRSAFSLTEVGGIVTLGHELPGDAMTCGPALPGFEVTFDDGELVVGGPAISVEGIHTGDLARLDGNDLRLEGRREERIVLSTGVVSLLHAETALRRSVYIREAVVLSDGDHTVVTVELIAEAVERWASDRNITFASFRALADTDEVMALVRAELEPRAAKAGLPGLDEIRVLPVSLEEIPGALTPSGRIRREVVHAAGGTTLAHPV